MDKAGEMDEADEWHDTFLKGLLSSATLRTGFLAMTKGAPAANS